MLTVVLMVYTLNLLERKLSHFQTNTPNTDHNLQHFSLLR